MIKVLYINPNVGSGIENIGNEILDILKPFTDCNIMEYKYQNPAFIVLPEIIKFNPDVIILNEFYPRILQAMSFYKIMQSKVKLILINHTLSTLKYFPLKCEAEHNKIYGADMIVQVNHTIINEVDLILNLDWKPEIVGIPDIIRRKTTSILFPVDGNKFKINVPWKERKKDFFYFGNVLPHKFSEEFLDTLKDSEIKIDIYGKLSEEPEYIEYNKKIMNHPSINYHGWVEPDKVVDIMNEYKFFLSPRGGHEPFMMTMAEVIMCGCIPLVVNDRRKAESDWIEHYRGCYVEYQTVDKLIEKMRWYKSVDKTEVDSTLNETSTNNSNEMKKRTDPENIKSYLYGAIHNAI